MGRFRGGAADGLAPGSAAPAAFTHGRRLVFHDYESRARVSAFLVIDRYLFTAALSISRPDLHIPIIQIVRAPRLFARRFRWLGGLERLGLIEMSIFLPGDLQARKTGPVMLMCSAV
jgi:hypothetical protein